LASCSPAASQGLPQTVVVAHSRLRESDKLRQSLSTLITLYPDLRESLRHIIIVGAWTEYIKNTQLRHEYGSIRVYCADISSSTLSTSAPGPYPGASRRNSNFPSARASGCARQRGRVGGARDAPAGTATYSRPPSEARILSHLAPLFPLCHARSRHRSVSRCLPPFQSHRPPTPVASRPAFPPPPPPPPWKTGRPPPPPPRRRSSGVAG